MGIEVGGILGLFILIADIWAIVKTFESPTSTGTKVLWIVLILLLPILGLIIWMIAGPRPRKI
jgi:succinate dehydrogenase/fumarate reductase cytochrome b subunit